MASHIVATRGDCFNRDEDLYLELYYGAVEQDWLMIVRWSSFGEMRLFLLKTITVPHIELALQNCCLCD